MRTQRKPYRTGLNDMEKAFCKEYIIDWNATRAYNKVRPGVDKTIAGPMGHQLLKKQKIKNYIAEIQKDLRIVTGVSAARNIIELAKIAYTNVADLFEDWDKLKKMSSLTEEQRAIISELQSIEKTISGKGEDVTIKNVKIKSHDKLRAIEMINKMMGFNAPEQVEQKVIESKEIKLQGLDLSDLTDEELKVFKKVAEKTIQQETEEDEE